MNVFLPIAEVSVNIVAILSLSGVVGVLSGLFGVGGGFLMTPFLIFFVSISIPWLFVLIASYWQIVLIFNKIYSIN